MCLREFPARPDTNRPAQPQTVARFFEISAIESRDNILSKQRTIKALIDCADRQADLRLCSLHMT